MDYGSENGGNSLLAGIIGSLIGGFIVYLLLKDRLIPTGQQQTSSLQHTRHTHTQRTDNIWEPRPLNLVNEYKNDERWKIVRNSDGDIDEISVVRDAKINGN